MFFWGIISLYNDFRHKIMRMRVGDYGDDAAELRKVRLIDVTPLTGYIFANSFLAFVFNLIITTIVCIPFCWTLTY